MNLSDYRHSAPEKARVNDLLSLIPGEGRSALDIGARDGFISRLLAEHFPKVTALDLDKPVIDHPQVECVKGNITALQFGDSSFDMVLCAEVLEHIPPHLLQIACGELARVTKEYLIIGVPYQQDIRVGRTTCRSCGNVNPPWGHVNSFDEKQLKQLFSGCAVVKTSFVGQTDVSTNALSCALMDLAGNPYGTYAQEEPCIHCNVPLSLPPARTGWQKVLTKAAITLMKVQGLFMKPHGNWIHLLLRKQTP